MGKINGCGSERQPPGCRARGHDNFLFVNKLFKLIAIDFFD